MIVSDPRVMMGKAVVAGTRITVEHILEELAAGAAVEQLLDAHPRLTREGISAALSFAAEALRTAARSSRIAEFSPATLRDGVFQEASMAMEQLKNGFWQAVVDCLEQFHGFSCTEARARTFDLRSAIEGGPQSGFEPDLIYHNEPFHLACDLASHELDLTLHMANYQRILARRFDRIGAAGPEPSGAVSLDEALRTAERGR